MKNAFILKDDWLKYGQGISELAYDETNNKCVYHQLTQFLINPKSGNKQMFLNKNKINEDTLFDYFSRLYKSSSSLDDEDIEEFTITSGVNTNMIKSLMIELGRNMYAYDSDQKIFSIVNHFDSKHYCPLVFYKSNKHFYLLNDKDVIRSVAENNKSNSKKIISSSCEEKQEIIVSRKLIDTNMETFNLDNALDLPAGVYLMQQPNLNHELLSFISKYKTIPLTKNSGNTICQIQYHNHKQIELMKKMEWSEKRNIKGNVIIAIDANYNSNDNIDYSN